MSERLRSQQSTGYTVGRSPAKVERAVLSATYMVWASDKQEAVAIARRLWADAHSEHVTSAVAVRFPQGADYHVNWRVEITARG